MAESNPDALPGDAAFERKVAVMLEAYNQRARRRTMVADPEGAIRVMLRAWERYKSVHRGRKTR